MLSGKLVVANLHVMKVAAHSEIENVIRFFQCSYLLKGTITAFHGNE